MDKEGDVSQIDTKIHKKVKKKYKAKKKKMFNNKTVFCRLYLYLRNHNHNKRYTLQFVSEKYEIGKIYFCQAISYVKYEPFFGNWKKNMTVKNI